MSHDVSVSVADALRIMIVIILSLDLGLAVWVMAVYVTANRHIRKVDPVSAGVLIRYVASMTTSYILLAGFGVAEIQGFYGTPLTYRAPIGFLAAISGLYALTNMATFQENRLNLRDENITVRGTPEP